MSNSIQKFPDHCPNPLFCSGDMGDKILDAQRKVREDNEGKATHGRLVLLQIGASLELGGLHPVYETVNDWLYDFYPDLDWENCAADLQAMQDAPEYPEIMAKFKELTGYDLDLEIDSAKAAESIDSDLEGEE